MSSSSVTVRRGNLTSNIRNNEVHFIVGNTYKMLSLSEAKCSRNNRNLKKVHDWLLYVDMIFGDAWNMIDCVTFDLGSTFEPQLYVCSYPIPIQRGRTTAWRFCTRQQSYGAITAKIMIRGIGGSRHDTTHTIQLSNSNKKSIVHEFFEHEKLRRHKPIRMPPHQQFGIELELASDMRLSLEAIANILNSNRNWNHSSIHVEVLRDYAAGRATSPFWKIVPDSSIVCSLTSPDCNKFKLVSPILKGRDGLYILSAVLRELNNLSPKLKVNKSMGFHVHIDVSSYFLSQIIKICQNVIKYERVLDTFMPPSRRTNSPEGRKYFISNRQSITNQICNSYSTTASNKQCHNAIGECQSLQSLCQLMNEKGKYYKLNLVTDPQPTIEFRQHSATVDIDKINYWIRFCALFCTNSAKLKSPTSFAEGRSLDFQMDALFHYVIKDRAIYSFYKKRQRDLRHNNNNNCCHECHTDRICRGKSQ